MPGKINRVDERTLRELFNRMYWDDIQAGKYLLFPLEENHPSPPLAGEPFCTRSQMIEYKDARGKRVARCHRYLRPDGTIGLSGRPDPKSVAIGEDLFILDSGLQKAPRR